MTLRSTVLLLTLLMGAGIAGAQAPSEVAGERTEVFGGFSYLALNYQRGFANAGLPGWDAAWSTPLKGSIALAVDGAGCYQGHDLGAPFYGLRAPQRDDGGVDWRFQCGHHPEPCLELHPGNRRRRRDGYEIRGTPEMALCRRLYPHKFHVGERSDPRGHGFERARHNRASIPVLIIARYTQPTKASHRRRAAPASSESPPSSVGRESIRRCGERRCRCR
jgi:hypothetical protein